MKRTSAEGNSVLVVKSVFCLLRRVKMSENDDDDGDDELGGF